jgi:hypothetical protein
MTLAILVLVSWYILGISGFIFWWTKEHDLDTGAMGAGLLFALIGPLTWIVGWFVHGDIIFIKKRD